MAAMYKYRDVEAKLMNNLQFSEVQADGYASGFEKLAAWVDESLEAYRPELSQVRPCMHTACVPTKRARQAPSVRIVLHEGWRPRVGRRGAKLTAPLHNRHTWQWLRGGLPS